ncbi:ribokinase [Halobacillus trueperi]|uniref:Ribokinase n=1 Tax=Halobacillus trueperi TaxID=156205 RepID=A0A3D8VPL6_9BACI|nr:ribokinase [Halobacillus trueperi]RDY71183.1 ribokinase [Halobacillus trueperi]
MRKPKIAVVGSSSMDLVVTSKKRPKPGETVLGDSFKTVPGGKGANQAVAAARLGAEVYMVGCVGRDDYGNQILHNFKSNGIHTDFLQQVPNEKTGTAHIILAEGDNSIVVVKGANDLVTPAYVKKARALLESCDLVMIQQEVPEETVAETAMLCHTAGVPLLLNPAPARPVSEKVIAQVSYLTPNELETTLMFEGKDRSKVLKQYPNKLFITEGAAGVRYFDGKEELLVPSFPVKTVDTTGAGDTFNAAFGTAIAEGKDLKVSLRFANRAASLSVTEFGAQGGMPLRTDVEKGLLE